MEERRLQQEEDDAVKYNILCRVSARRQPAAALQGPRALGSANGAFDTTETARVAPRDSSARAPRPRRRSRQLCTNQPGPASGCVRRAARNRHRHAIEQASHRWRGGRREDSARTRRKILISTQVQTRTRGAPRRRPRGNKAPGARARRGSREDARASGMKQNGPRLFLALRGSGLPNDLRSRTENFERPEEAG